MMDRRNINYRKRRSYYDDYKKTVSGEYVYAGALYEFIGKNGKSRKRWMCEMLLMCIAAFGILLIPGFMYVPGMNNCVYVLLPYGAGILITGYLIVVMVRLAAAKDSVKAWEFDKSVKVLPKSTVIACCVAVLCIAAEIVYISLNGVGEMFAGCVVYMVCHIVFAVLAILEIRHVKSAEWKLKETTIC